MVKTVLPQLDRLRLKSVFAEYGLPLRTQQIEKFATYYHELIAWNRRAKLISQGDEGRIVERHFLESSLIALCRCVAPGSTILDLGSGGGFPGMPLKIVIADLKVVLLDSKRWKSIFLNHLVSKLGLESDVSVVCQRAETAVTRPEFHARFDVVVGRAVCTLAEFYLLASPFLRPDGMIVALKGSDANREVDQLIQEHPDLRIEVRPFPNDRKNLYEKQKIVIIMASI